MTKRTFSLNWIQCLLVTVLVMAVVLSPSVHAQNAADIQPTKDAITLQLSVKLDDSRTILVCTLTNDSQKSFATLPVGLGSSRLVVVNAQGQESEIYNMPIHGVRPDDLQVIPPSESFTWTWNASIKCGLHGTLLHKREPGQYHIYWKILDLKKGRQAVQERYRSNLISIVKVPETFQFPRFEAITGAMLRQPMPEEQRVELKRLADAINEELIALSGRALWDKTEKEAPKGINNNLKKLLDEVLQKGGAAPVGAVLFDTGA